MAKVYKSGPLKEEMKKEGVPVGKNDSGIIAVAFGILSIVFAFSLFLGSMAGLILGIVGLFFSWRQARVWKNSWSRAGFILNILGIIVNMIIVYFVIQYIMSEVVPAIEQATMQTQNLQDFVGQGGYP